MKSLELNGQVFGYDESLIIKTKATNNVGNWWVLTIDDSGNSKFRRINKVPSNKSVYLSIKKIWKWACDGAHKMIIGYGKKGTPMVYRKVIEIR